MARELLGFQRNSPNAVVFLLSHMERNYAMWENSGAENSERGHKTGQMGAKSKNTN